MTLLHYIIGILISVIIGLIISLRITTNERSIATNERNEARRILQLTKDKNDELLRKYEKIRKALFKAIELKQNIPEDCKLGPWCKGCMYVKRHTYSIGHFEKAKLVYCGKEEACKYFVQKETETGGENLMSRPKIYAVDFDGTLEL